MNKDYKLALKIRAVEEAFLDLFTKGLLNGTVHTCIGQELSAVSICKYLSKNDYVFSNHRCHGHFIAFTKNYKKLINELLGKKTGICGGVGGSQHISNKNFFSNGPQGSLTPVAVGVSKGLKLNKNNNVSVCFIGDGTLGEGVVYEAMNLASLYNLPILFVCENNQYAQSTHISNNLAGSIEKRAESFGLQTYTANTWDYTELSSMTKNVISNVRNSQPSFLLINTYRLKAHSKGDDDRNLDEVKHYDKIDLLNSELNNNQDFVAYYDKVKAEIDNYIKSVFNEKELDYKLYSNEKASPKEKPLWANHKIEIKEKQVDTINKYFLNAINNNNKVLLIGEDISDPYGGAFKVTKNISSQYPKNVISTPISEAGIVGMGIGLSLVGYKPFVEIMFGDFISYSFDQILSNATKFYHMYNKQVNIPLVIRTPMGGGRGYGPTHSQSIEKIFIGLNNLQIVALNTLINPEEVYSLIEKNEHTSIVIENKLDYGRLINKIPDSIKYNFTKSKSDYPIVVGKPVDLESKLCLITYGGSVHHVFESIEKIFTEFEILPKIIVLTKLYPLQKDVISNLVKESNTIVTVEESNVEGGFGSEIISTLMEVNGYNSKTYLRIGSENIPIPSTKKLEEEVLVSVKKIINKLKKIL
jgi:2-oxoisovalerate dehydrogenase E1 component